MIELENFSIEMTIIIKTEVIITMAKVRTKATETIIKEEIFNPREVLTETNTAQMSPDNIIIKMKDVVTTTNPIDNGEVNLVTSLIGSISFPEMRKESTSKTNQNSLTFLGDSLILQEEKKAVPPIQADLLFTLATKVIMISKDNLATVALKAQVREEIMRSL